jgi:hypothetical protein
VKIMWIGYPHMPTGREAWLVWKVSGFAKKHHIAD